MTIETLPDHLESVLVDAQRFAVRRRAEWGQVPDPAYRELFSDAEWEDEQGVAAASAKVPIPRTIRFEQQTGRSTFPTLFSDAEREAVRRDAAKGELGRWPIGLLALNFSQDELVSLLVTADAAQRAAAATKQDRRRVAKATAELQAEMRRVEAEDEAKRRAQIEARARKQLGWPPTGWPDPDDPGDA